ncbi:purine-nucleoside phosphorylase [Glaciecola punicea]|jgi:purine-nucleoside phosphorylase|uniref:purine-nucleoside phosphorylase n=1 Tax=Glaciecola punicea TaxID=56804 RepID=UPI0008732408|nr:purine-nucleoside phosphorylase [Glaciecola punicea]OFA29939.1 purine-nucleoside phosphorylase [Glaciecola punicea]
MKKEQLAKINEAQAYIQARTNIKPMCGLILGSGLGELADALDDFFYIEYKDIPHFPVSSAPSHKGRLCFGYLSGVPLVLMQGRVHTYEGYTPQDVAFPVYVMKQLGIKNLVLTNAAGGVNKSFKVGDIMVIKDHVNMPGMTGLDPTRGSHNADFGSRFTSLNNCYDAELRQLIKAVAVKIKMPLHEGVYSYLVGPSFETPAEIRFLNLLGVDATGMSTVPEVIAARNAGIKVLALSSITNMAVHNVEDTHITSEEEVWENVVAIVPKLKKLIETLLGRLSHEKG